MPVVVPLVLVVGALVLVGELVVGFEVVPGVDVVDLFVELELDLVVGLGALVEVVL